MTDDVKAAVEWLRKLSADCSGIWPRGSKPRQSRFLDVSPDEVDALLAHLDGEPGRLAAAREEQRAHDLAYFAFRDRVIHDLHARAEKAEAERDELRWRIRDAFAELRGDAEAYAKTLAYLSSVGAKGHDVDGDAQQGIASLVEERDEARAQVERVREVCARPWPRGGAAVTLAVLDALEGK